ncbi:hypothetical protein LNO16_12750, partial [Klebsiella quasipneumoniae subsp. quasipneumoniae]|uniref:hypothetical protein n=1 Tax=Klebsiella quasipneumoniae TaxID=1463165 RepID=UPI00217D0D75
TPYPRLCRMAASMPYPAYGSSRRLKKRRPAQAQRRRAGDHRVEFDEKVRMQKSKNPPFGRVL